ncbi:MAG TPA: hypothetical protein VG271_10935 [Beijerinckiaceae bacterium]|jgi:hypothetical protein|nr:hypothetical protein [Beijerinckiaceae bacterium]
MSSPLAAQPQVAAVIGDESSASAVSWAAVLAGTAVALAMALILLALGAGIGLAAISPWGGGFSGTTFTVYSAIWLIIVQWVSSALGGYTTGRLRTKWVGIHTDEVFFRDTAHGLLAWAVAVIIGVGVLGSATTSLIGGAAHTVANTTASTAGPQDYFVDSLFRSSTPSGNTPANATDVRAQATRIFAESARNGGFSDADRGYLVQLVAAQTGLSQADASKRVDDVINDAKTAADKARKAASGASIFSFFSLLIGAFIACVAGAIGGRERDH